MYYILKMTTNEEVKNTISLSIPWYTIIQASLLVYTYSTDVYLPWWVTWFPTVCTGIVFVIAIVVMMIVGIIALIGYILENVF